MKMLLLAVIATVLMTNVAYAQATPVQDVLQSHRALIEKSSRRTIGPAIDAMAGSGLPQMQGVLEAWQSKNMWQRKEDGLFFLAVKNDDGSYALTDFEDGAAIGDFDKKALSQLKPNSGVRGMIATALVKFQLSDPDPAKRADALNSIARDPEATIGDRGDRPSAQDRANHNGAIVRINRDGRGSVSSLTRDFSRGAIAALANSQIGAVT